MLPDVDQFGKRVLVLLIDDRDLWVRYRIARAGGSLGRITHDARTLRCGSLMAHAHEGHQYRDETSESVRAHMCLGPA